MTNRRRVLMTGKCEVPKIDNGTLQSGFHVGSFVNHGNVLDYRCNDGFTNETSKPQCNNGTWTTTPLCVPGRRSCYLDQWVRLFAYATFREKRIKTVRGVTV